MADFFLHGFPKLIAGCIHLPVDFMTPEYGHGWWRYAHLVATERKLKLNLGSIEPEVIETYANVFPPNTLHILPSYFDGWTRTSEDRSPLKIGFFGHQRREKGTDFLDQLIERLLPSYQVVVHDSSGSLTTGFRHPNLELHGYVDNLAILMSTCDIVILPYIATQYKAKGSGILWDAVASGIPIVAPSNSTPGRFVSKHQLGTVFENDTVHSVMDATERLVKSLGDFKLRCQDFAQDWRRKNGFEQFMRSFLLNHLSAQPPKSVTFKLGTIQYRI
jgi:glycosyltransferase involved in cell wall biosynthesis